MRQIVAAIMAASLVWVGSAGAAQAHSHDVDGHHGAAVYAVATVDDYRHGADHRHDDHPDDHQQASDPDDDGGGVPHEHERGIFHVHVLTFVALEAEYPVLPQVQSVKSIETPLLSVSLLTRSVMPADRPPRTFL